MQFCRLGLEFCGSTTKFCGPTTNSATPTTKWRGPTTETRGPSPLLLAWMRGDTFAPELRVTRAALETSLPVEARVRWTILVGAGLGLAGCDPGSKSESELVDSHPVDADGDGLTAGEDCDDADPQAAEVAYDGVD